MQQPHTTMNWNLDSFAMAAPKEQVSASDLNGLLKGRNFKKNAEVNTDMCPPSVMQYDAVEMNELEAYCRKHGIVGVGIGNMSPRATLKMLMAQRGDRSSINETKRVLLNG
jgi:hypothetical protein